MSAPVDASGAVQSLVETVWRLRQPDGCPWDREQTHASIGKNMVEEAYEALESIEDGDASHLREELGDVLLQVVLHAQIAADAEEFTFEDVARDVDRKLVRRHPHVFGEINAESSDDVLRIWEQVKLQERAGADEARTVDTPDIADADETAPPGLLDGVPKALPALMQAQNVSRKVAAVGFDWASIEDVWEQADRERLEFQHERPGSAERELEFGDLLFSLVNVARKEGFDAESALRASTSKFRARWRAVEQLAAQAGTAPEHLSRRDLNMLWEQAKAQESRIEDSSDQ